MKPPRVSTLRGQAPDDVEIATLEWVDWFNNTRLHTELGDIPPTEHEANHYRQNPTVTTAETREPSLH